MGENNWNGAHWTNGMHEQKEHAPSNEQKNIKN